MKKHSLTIVFVLLLCAGLIAFACSKDNDDDDDASSVDDDQTDDDAGNLDDDAVDDDAIDDDTADDDAIDDDTVDDDIADDDATGDVWTDSTSGLTWQNADGGELEWAGAVAYCENLTWGGFDDWRLPTLPELRSLIRDCDNTVTGGDCPVTADCLAYMTCWTPACNGCQYFGGPGPAGRYWPAELSGDGWIYWTSSEVDENPFTAWRIHFYSSLISYNDNDYAYSARCVR